MRGTVLALLACGAVLLVGLALPSEALAETSDWNPYTEPYDVTVAKSPSDKGTVTGGGIDCGETCTVRDVVNEAYGCEPGFGCSEFWSIVLDAHPASGYVLDRWEGACTYEGNTGGPCYVFSDGPDVTVTPHFRKAECADGVDNDSDGKVDHPAAKEGSDPPEDPDCESVFDDSEAYVPPPDTTPPNLTVSPASIGLTNDSTPTVEFSSAESGVKFRCSVYADQAFYEPVPGHRYNNYTDDNCTSPFTTPPLPEGDAQIIVVAKDAAGNESPWERRYLTVDTTPADTSIISGPSGTDRSTSPSFSFSASQADSKFECRLDGGEWATCTSPKHYSSLGEGQHTFEVAATDPAGNRDSEPAARSWKVDSVAPKVTGVSPPSGATGVSANTNVLAAFSEEMREGSITTSTVRLTRKGSSLLVPASVSYDPSTKRVTLDPDAALKAGASYTATVTTGVGDLAGNPMAVSKSWSFAVKR